MKVYPITASHLFVRQVGTLVQREEILKQAQHFKEHNIKEMPEYGTNDKCWRSYERLDNIDWLVDELKDMASEVIGFYLQNDEGYAPMMEGYEGFNYDYWINVNDPGSINENHNHRRFALAACYQVQALGTGSTEFWNESNLLNECSAQAPFTTRKQYEPADGDLMMWPAWVPHNVNLNTSDRQRINIAFNMWFTK